MCRALMRWEVLREDGRLPLDGRLDLRDDPDLAPHAYYVRLTDPIRLSCLEYCGSVLAGLCGDDPTGQPIGQALPCGIRDRMVDFLHSAARYRQVLADSSSFIGRHGDILYRNMIMPMQDSAGTVVSLVGAFNYRIEA
jgi:hypothetical protein